MKTTFIVTSAMITNLGVYDPLSRMQQTYQTMDSIQSKFPDAKILLVEAGDIKIRGVQDSIWADLRDRATAYLDLTDDETLQYLKTLPVSHNREMGGPSGLIKSMSECVAFHQALIKIRDVAALADLKNVDRIFKLSGRYALSPMFNPTDWDHPGQYVFKQRTRSWMPEGGYLFQSRLWSFDAALLDQTIASYEVMMTDLEQLAEANKYMDVEHLLFKHIGPDHSKELEYTHCMGTMAPNGTMIYD